MNPSHPARRPSSMRPRIRIPPRAKESVSDKRPVKDMKIKPEDISKIGNKDHRSNVFNRYKMKKRGERRAKRKQTKAIKESGDTEEIAKIQVPDTIESLAPPNAAAINIDDSDEAGEIANNKDVLYFQQYLRGEKTPRILITTNKHPKGTAALALVSDLLMIFPTNMEYIKRSVALVGQLIKMARARGFTHLVVVKEDNKIPNNIMITELAYGPTASFNLVDYTLMKDLKGRAVPLDTKSEVFMNRFSSAAGRATAMLLSSLFGKPELQSRQMVTLHNQRDYIFLRAHRYVFELTKPGKEGEAPRDLLTTKGLQVKNIGIHKPEVQAETTVGARLQELGPRLTLKLVSLQRGPFNPLRGQYVWVGRRQGDANSDRLGFVM